MQWFKQQSRKRKVVILVSVPLLPSAPCSWLPNSKRQNRNGKKPFGRWRETTAVEADVYGVDAARVERDRVAGKPKGEEEE